MQRGDRMDDLISRRAAIDAVNGMPDCPNGYSDTYDKAHIIAVLEDVPSVHSDFDTYCDRLWKLAYERGKRDVQPQRWTPVAEALPRDDEDVIVTCLDDSGDTPFRYTTVAWHYAGMWVCDNERCPFVTAWMPLPEPWREQE